MNIRTLVLNRLNGPILLTKIVHRFFHLAVLPASADVAELREMAREQARANRLNVWLYTRSTDDLHIRIPEDAAPGSASPFDDLGHYMSLPVAGRLELSPLVCEDDTLAVRNAQLVDLVDTYRERQEPEVRSRRLPLPADWVLGDATKGGAIVCEQEACLLASWRQNDLPGGLARCATCGELRGECVDLEGPFENLVVPVHCACDNVNRCARCRQLLSRRRLNGNQYDEEEGKIWHLPGFAAFQHACPDKVAAAWNVTS